jgi:hypothetical protein
MSHFHSAVPEGIGTDRNLPPEIREAAGLRRKVIAWTALDPKYRVDRITCCETFGPVLLLPCLWHGLICFPILFACALMSRNRIKNQYWLLTSTELKVITKSHEACLPGCCRMGHVVTTIPLDTITDCGVKSRAIYVDTARSYKDSEGKWIHTAEGHGLTGYSWFVREVLHRREMVNKNDHNLDGPGVEVVTAVPVMDRGSSVNDSVEEITKLHENGVLTKEEYTKKLQEIIDSIQTASALIPVALDVHLNTLDVPEGIGTDRDLPPEIRETAGLRSEVIAWTALDRQYESDLGRITYCATFGPVLLIPCFWLHGIILFPCLCAAAHSSQNRIKNQYWILTSTELMVITKTGRLVKSIPLDNIITCGVKSPTTGRCSSCVGALPSIYVGTASSGGGSDGGQQYDAFGRGLAGYSWFTSEILHRRDIIKGRSALPSSSDIIHAADVVNAIPVMDRGSSVIESVEARLQKITKFHEDGVFQAAPKNH